MDAICASVSYGHEHRQRQTYPRAACRWTSWPWAGWACVGVLVEAGSGAGVWIARESCGAVVSEL